MFLGVDGREDFCLRGVLWRTLRNRDAFFELYSANVERCWLIIRMKYLGACDCLLYLTSVNSWGQNQHFIFRDQRKNNTIQGCNCLGV